MALVADEGLALFAGLNVDPQEELTCPSTPPASTTRRRAGSWPPGTAQVAGTSPLRPAPPSISTSTPCPTTASTRVVERHYVSARSRRQPSVLVFLAQDADGPGFCYSNADLRKGEEAEEIFRFIAFWKRDHTGSARGTWSSTRKLTTYAEPGRGSTDMDITFITLRRRSPALLKEIVTAAPLGVADASSSTSPRASTRRPRVFEQPVALAGRHLPPALHPGPRATTSRPSC